MHRIISRWPIRSSSEVFSGCILIKRGKINGLVAAESFQTAADWKGNFGYGGESTSKPIGQQVVNALQLGHRNQASSLLSEFDAARDMMNAENIVSILEYCANKPDPLFVMETWRVLQEKKITLTKHYYLLIVRALVNGGHIEEAIRLVKFLGENHHVNFTLPVYCFLLSACAKMKDVTYRDQCLNLMDNHLLGKNEHTYTTLLKLAVWDKNLLAVHEILRELCKCYNPNMISSRKFIQAFAELKDLESAYKTLQYMVSIAFKEGTYLRRTMRGRIICSNLDIPIPSATVTSILDSDLSQNEDKQCIPLNARMLKNGPIKKVLRWSFNDVIRACGPENVELIWKLIMQMQNLGLEPSPWTYHFFVKAAIPGRKIHDVVEFLKIMEEKEVKLYDSTLIILSISFSKALMLDSAESFLNQITRSSNPYSYNAFFAACDKMEQPERAISMLVKMRDLKVKPNITTYALLFSLFGNVYAPYEKGNLFSQAVVNQRVDAIQADMLESGVQHSQYSMYCMVNNTLHLATALYSLNCLLAKMLKCSFSLLSHAVLMFYDRRVFGF